MNYCDWTDCAVEVGLFDGVPASLLNPEDRKNVPNGRNGFTSLCPEHFDLAVANLDEPKTTRFERKQAEYFAIVVLLVLVTVTYLGLR